MLKIAIIGSGFGFYGLLPAFRSIKKCKVVSICGMKNKRLIRYCQSIGLKSIYTDWQLMLDREKLDAVAIAVPPNIQYQIAKVAIKKNLHIFAEKPLAVTLTQARELFLLAHRKKIISAVDFIFPDIEEWRKVKQLITTKKCGQLKHIAVNWDFLSYDIRNKVSSWKTDVSEGGGALSFYFSHSLYYLEYYAGEIITIKSLLSYSKESINGGETGIDLIVKFKNNVTGYAHLNCNVKGLNRHQLIFIFEKGTIILENEVDSIVNFIIKIYTENKVEQLNVAKDKPVRKDKDERVQIVKKIASRFIDACILGEQVIPSFKEGVRVQELIEKIRKQA